MLRCTSGRLRDLAELVVGEDDTIPIVVFDAGKDAFALFGGKVFFAWVEDFSKAHNKSFACPYLVVADSTSTQFYHPNSVFLTWIEVFNTQSLAMKTREVLMGTIVLRAYKAVKSIVIPLGKSLFKLRDCSKSQRLNSVRISSILVLASWVASISRIFTSLPSTRMVLVMSGVVLTSAWRKRAIPS